MKKVFLLAGEASGDALGASLMQEIKARYPDVTLRGVGGHLMEAQGLDVLLPSDELSVMGIWEIIGNLARLKGLHHKIVLDIEAFEPDVVVTIDFPDFNFLLGKALKSRGKSKAKLVHYVAPSVWAWRPGRAKAVSKFLDGMICLFPFEPKFFQAHGLETECVGHPLVTDKPDHSDGSGFRQRYNIPSDAKTFGLFMGSRMSELKMMSQTLKDVASMVQESHPDVHFIVPTLPHLEFEVLKMFDEFDAPVYVVTNLAQKWDAFMACDAALAVSGTVGLELCYCGVPHAIAYKARLPTWAIIKVMVRVKYAHLVNILLNGSYIPEFLQFQCDAIKIGNTVLDLLEGSAQDSVMQQKNASLKIRRLIGAYDKYLPSQKAVNFIEAVVAGTVKQKMPTQVTKAKHKVQSHHREEKGESMLNRLSYKKGMPPKKREPDQRKKLEGLTVLKKIWAFLRNL